MKISRLISRLSRELKRLHPSERALERNQSLLRKNFLERYWREVSGQTGAHCENMGNRFRRLSRGDSWTIVFDGDVMLDSRVALRMAGNKLLMYRLMQDWGISNIPDYRVCALDDISGAVELLQLGQVVTKPAAGTGAGRGITTRINNRRSLRDGVAAASVYDDTVLVERHIEANSYRLLYLDGELLDAIWRRQPSVLGDGTSTIDELVEQENRLRIDDAGTRALSLLTRNLEYRQHLHSLGYTGKSIPPAGETLAVKSVVNQNNNSENERILDSVHSSVVEKCADICAMAKLRLVGLDLLADDVRIAWDQQQIYVNELNTTPGLHHHVLTSTGSDDHRVGTAIVNCLLS
jgi:D-alanine-D-alanine ligase-like ATP-grasp enzyme